MTTRLILVADASRARLFRDHQSGKSYELVESFEHSASRARGRDLVSDASGRKPSGASAGARIGGSGAAPDTDPKEVEAEKFARELSTVLATKLNGHEFDRLVLTAPPQFLGLLKSSLSREVTKHVESSINKDLTKLEGREIRDHIHADLAPIMIS